MTYSVQYSVVQDAVVPALTQCKSLILFVSVTVYTVYGIDWDANPKNSFKLLSRQVYEWNRVITS